MYVESLLLSTEEGAVLVDTCCASSGRRRGTWTGACLFIYLVFPSGLGHSCSLMAFFQVWALACVHAQWLQGAPVSLQFIETISPQSGSFLRQSPGWPSEGSDLASAQPCDSYPQSQMCHFLSMWWEIDEWLNFYHPASPLHGHSAGLEYRQHCHGTPPEARCLLCHPLPLRIIL